MTKKKHPFLKILLIALAAILFWRGVWGLIDLYLFPDNPLISNLVSLILGIILLFTTRTLAEDLV